MCAETVPWRWHRSPTTDALPAVDRRGVGLQARYFLGVANGCHREHAGNF
jgi:hypothetical protein